MSEHIVPRKVYYSVFGALIVLTAVTVVAANFDFGRMNDVVAMTIAVTKMMLVLLFFMHVRYSSRLIWVVVAANFDFGRMNDVVAMTIAVTKMMLVLLFFMHVRYSSRLIWVVVASMFFWLLILLLLTLTDYTSRDWFGPNQGGRMIMH